MLGAGRPNKSPASPLALLPQFLDALPSFPPFPSPLLTLGLQSVDHYS